MAKYRKQRINDSVAEEMSLILRDVKDPRVSGGMLTVTGADVSADLKYAKIFFSLYGGDVRETMQGLRSASGFIRGQLARRLNLRITPELTFVHDDSVGHGAHIAQLLHEIGVTSDSPGNTETEAAEEKGQAEAAPDEEEAEDDER